MSSSPVSNHNDNNNTDDVLYSIMVTSGCVTFLLASVLAYTLLYVKPQKNKNVQDTQSSVDNQSNHHTNGGVTSSQQLQSTTTTTTTIEEEEAKQYPGGMISIYYGTQTGTAESFARVLEREAKEQNSIFGIKVIDLEDITSLSQLGTKCIFIVATYGEGEPTDNTTNFVSLLKERTQLDVLFNPEDIQNNKLNDDVTNNTYNSADNVRTIHYSVFGLGNKQYDHYNSMGKYFDTSFQLLNHPDKNDTITTYYKQMTPLGLGDDDDDLEMDFDQWKDNILWPTLKKLFYVPVETENNNEKEKKSDTTTTTTKSTTTISQTLPDCRYSIQYYNKDTDDNNTMKLYIDSNSTSRDLLLKNTIHLDQVHNSSKHYFTSYDCPITIKRELRNHQTKDNNDDHHQQIGSTLHIEFDISNAIGSSGCNVPLQYVTADNLGILPKNDDCIVESVAKSLNLRNIDTTIFELKPSVSSSSGGGSSSSGFQLPFPMPITIRECLTRYCDLTGTLRRSDLKLLASYATDPIDQKFLLRLSSSSNKDGKEEYKTKILNEYIGLQKLLLLCPSLQSIPFEHFLNICPLIQSRYYTISSSSSFYPNSIHITVAVTQEYDTKTTTTTTPKFKGLCSNYLANCTVDGSSSSYVRVYVRPSTFRLPPDISKPILCIGPGTGIAPMRALLQERQYQQQKSSSSLVGPNILYFGCKKSNEDYIYRDEIETFQNNGILSSYYVAFSREDNTKKVYVQHLLKQNSDSIYELIHYQGCYIYICGGVQMGHDVVETLKDIIVSHHSQQQEQQKLIQNGNSSFTREHAKEYVNKLSHDHRLVQELWA